MQAGRLHRVCHIPSSASFFVIIDGGGGRICCIKPSGCRSSNDEEKVDVAGTFIGRRYLNLLDYTCGDVRSSRAEEASGPP